MPPPVVENITVWIGNKRRDHVPVIVLGLTHDEELPSGRGETR